jgi:hypothetical protein
MLHKRRNKRRQRESVPAVSKSTDSEAVKQVEVSIVKQFEAPAVKQVVAPAVKQVVAPAVKQVVTPAVKQVVAPAVKQVVAPAVKQVEAPAVKQVVTPAVKKAYAASVNYSTHVPGPTKTIIFKWVQVKDVITNKKNYSWGLGDIIRGMIAVYQYCKANRYEFIVDISQHPLSAYLSPTSIYCKTTPYKKVKMIGNDGGVYDSFNVNFDTSITISLFSNVWPILPLLKDEKELVKSVVSMNTTLISKPISMKYNVIHFRTGDTSMLDNKGVNVSKYKELLEKYAKPGDYIITDNNKLKDWIVTENPGYNVLNHNKPIAHSGYASNDLKYVLEDLQLLSGAQCVYTYSIYDWVSGFVDWICKCYDVNLVDMKYDEKISDIHDLPSAASKNDHHITPTPE